MVREAMGLTQGDFASKLGLKIYQVKNIEYGTSRVPEKVFAIIGRSMSELLPWVVYGGTVSKDQLRQSQSELCKLIVARFDAGLVWDASFLGLDDGDQQA